MVNYYKNIIVYLVHVWNFIINASSSLSSWGTCLTFMNQNFMFLILWFKSEEHASPFLINLNFFLSLCLEVRHMRHLYQTKLYILNLYFWGETHVSPFLTYLNFSLSLWLETRHMDHPCEITIYVVEFVFCIL